MREHAIKLVAEVLFFDLSLSGHGALDRRDASVTCLDRNAPPIHLLLLQSNACFSDSAANGFGIMCSTRNEKPLVAQDEQRFGHRLKVGFGKSALEKRDKFLCFSSKRMRKFDKRARLHPFATHTEHRNDLLAQLRHAFAFARDDWRDGHSERLAQILSIDLVAILSRHIDHVQRENRWVTELDHLRREIQVALKV